MLHTELSFHISMQASPLVCAIVCARVCGGRGGRGGAGGYVGHRHTFMQTSMDVADYYLSLFMAVSKYI